MKRFVYAAAAGILFTSVALADNPPTTGTVSPAPVVTGTYTPSTGSYTYGSSTTSSGRRVGLLSRLRGRTSSGTVMSAPLAPVMPATTVTTPATGGTGTTGSTSSVPSPMPATGTSSAAPAVTGQPVVVAGSTILPDGTVIPAGGMMMTRNGRVVQASGTTMMMSGGTTQSVPCCGGDGQTGTMMATAMPVTTTNSQRTGLIARLRARR